MLGQKTWLIILVTKNNLQLVGLGESKVENIVIPNTVVSNMEVLNKDAIYTLVTDWLKQRPHTSASIIWLLSPEICFEHTFTSSEQDKVDSETLQFLDLVPFENVVSRAYNSSEGKQIIATNKDLIMSLVQAFSLQGYNTKAVVPSRLVQADSVLTSEVERLAIKRNYELARESLIAPTQTSALTPIGTSETQQSQSTDQSKSSLPLLLGVFVFLLAVLGFVLYLNK